MYVSWGCIFMAKKGQTFKTYSFETKLQAVRMRIEGKTKREIATELGIVDKDQIRNG
jgi:transposase